MLRKLALALSFAATLATAQQTSPASDPPVEKTKKNIKVLTGLPTSQLIPVMAFMSNSLGVTCAHCHTDKWESDEKQAKDVARTMVLMQRDINERHFGGELAVTCNSCHQGRLEPVSIPSLDRAGWNQPPAPPKPDLSKMPAAAELVTKYVKATGSGKPAAFDATATATRTNGRTDPTSGPVTFHVSAEGVKIDTDFSYPPDANRGPNTAFLGPLRISEMYKGMQVTGTDRVRGHDTYVVEARAAEGRAERLFFDKETGLLVRRYRETPTDYGVVPEAYDFEDYRDAAGMKIPFLITWSRADYKVTHKLEKVQ